MVCSAICNYFKVSFLGCKPLIDTVDTDFYTGKLVKVKNRSVEHILPKSKGGKNNIINYAMSDKTVNSERSNMSMQSWLNIHPDYLENMKKYVKKYWNTTILDVKHGQEVNKTLNKKYGINLIG